MPLRRLSVLVYLAVALAIPPAAAHAAGGNSVLTVTAGTLTITGAAPGNFSATLTGSDQQVYTTLGTYSASDTTGAANGWHVTFQATAFSCTVADAVCPATGDSLPASSLLMAPPTVACAGGTSCTGRAAPPAIKISANTALDSGAAVTVASAAAKTGMGTYTFTPGALGTGALQLTVPSFAYATTYHSTLTVSIVSGP
ncbi:MAG: WxL domain-containing protein [Chloroflexi bacterium]|nr:WxL domain-containing protein [Chloroflexota bacterium]